MRTVNAIGDSGKNSTASLEVAIKNLRFTDEVSNFKKSLVELSEEWLASEVASDAWTRGTMISHFNAMMTLLSAIERKEVVS